MAESRSVYVPLNVHSQYSILNSTASVSLLAKTAKRFKMPAIAITDDGNLYGVVDFYKACRSQGVKPIIGCEMWMAPSSRFEKKRTPGLSNGMPIVLLAKDYVGFQHLSRLSSIGFLEGFYYQPRIDKEVLTAHQEGLICLLSDITDVEWYHQLFGEDFYLDIRRHPLSRDEIQESWLAQKYRDAWETQEKKNQELIRLSKTLGIELVATNKIHYIEREDWRAHEILLNIQSGEPCEIWERDSQGNPKNKAANPKRETMSTRELYFKSPEEMADLFQDLPQALENTLKVAAKCNAELDFKTKHYPIFIPPGLDEKKATKKERLKVAEQFLYDLCVKGIQERYTPERLAKVPGDNPLDIVRKRFEYEFNILTSKGMCDYMLIVYDFISWAKARGIPVGPGRGSAAGSIISYLMGITDIEPLRFHLFFERFINPERISYPDIDVDICMDRRQEVIHYVVAKYGKEKVAQIITFGTMKAKMAIRDVGRVLNVPLSKVNKIAALVPEDPTMTLEKAFKIDPELARLMETDEEAKAVLEMAQKTEGSIRNTSTHAAGLIISASAIMEHIPVCTAKDSDMVVTQYAMKPVESVGMLKIDFLGLKTLTSIQKCANAVEKSTMQKIDWGNLPLDDQPTFDLLNQGKTLGVFQLESSGMQDLSKQLHIDVFEEVIAVGALYRPGPMDMIPSFINRKHGKEKIEIDHPLMKEILSETYGVMVYQEQVMQIASNLAGYSLGEGDVLRRAMGKKDREEMNRQKEKFVSGCENKGISPGTAVLIFEKIEKFASYGFNKSHAAAYAYLSYATAYFKANYPKEWMAALMTSDQHDTTKLAKFIAEAKSLNIRVLPPDINQASREFAASKDGIRFAMAGIKGMGIGGVDAILEEREKNGPYQNLFEFIQRVDKTRVGKKHIELLIDAGALDFTNGSRDAMRESVEEMYERALQEQKEKAMGVLNLFTFIETPEVAALTNPLKVVSPSTKLQLYQREKELLGFYLTGHPMDGYKKVLGRLSCVPLTEVGRLEDGSVFRAAFVVETATVKVSAKNQKKFAILIISDGIERFELPVWSELFEEKGALLNENQLLYGILQLEKKEGASQLSCRYLDDLVSIDEERIKLCDDALEKIRQQVKAKTGFDNKRKAKQEKEGKVEKENISKLSIEVDADRVRFSQILQLKELFRSYPGKSTLEMHFRVGSKRLGTVFVDSQWGVNANSEFQKKLAELIATFGSIFLS
ncbi:MAG: DNA polymerase III subunit alpha [Chlamydiae bacterium RIFCSPHIGHO2_12_FULL_44_59]|nr:MAG: DNA polymerase III subunit alpha [Chlamydiae bacterium RIFCSPHIGHO2_01_FULL_44_39]OGN58887.1 MAG: DNA polymerase III subunit alpha [Chlamydiae bacterium RIFCSPHIGHO2_02_FULL_45_9]OGN60568.1 MAG: DNA polymerase III subunit alpha [Chlamydiae bacterium RIFCSPHIGHO2_12_FULL_44_59]OGN66018.1 MAG: DNA polymerase III subunit alpha [Chlamydiae bacterium RIFCSPLOWO2_01_FULL_44_52]OGN68834.1 MAG: DNA polymerase III subunit alpha [Chlamydiae bacterium RIFCSPLOWO2_02_FULL_45_22]OGN70479.1 MAG: DNA